MADFEGYPAEALYDDDDDGTIVKNVETLAENVIGRKIVAVERDVPHKVPVYSNREEDKNNKKLLWVDNVSGTALVLDDGTRVLLVDTDDCCAYTELKDIVVNLDKIEHVILGVGTTEGYTKWHIYANLGDVVELKVKWHCGNPFYYGYGFDIYVIPEERGTNEELKAIAAA